ncbi:MAG: hypothetical protein IJS96_06715 [Schwartzia sp.]|nr:hypothetical protein [Schwartzia sp. (in: firmicutes)]
MPVRLGNSYVTEAARDYAQSQTSSATDSAGLLKELGEKFPGLKIQAGTAPFSGTGMNNVMISPKVLREMTRDPEKRQEYEALLYDVQWTSAGLGKNLPDGRRVKSHGFIITNDGGLRSWSISESTASNSRKNRSLFTVAKAGTKKLLPGKAAKNSAAKRAALSSNNTKATPAFRLTISDQAKRMAQR